MIKRPLWRDHLDKLAEIEEIERDIRHIVKVKGHLETGPNVEDLVARRDRMVAEAEALAERCFGTAKRESRNRDRVQFALSS